MTDKIEIIIHAVCVMACLAIIVLFGLEARDLAMNGLWIPSSLTAGCSLIMLTYVVVYMAVILKDTLTTKTS